MESTTADGAKRRFGDLLTAAQRHPVSITRHGQRRFVIMSASLYDRLCEIFMAHRRQEEAAKAAAAPGAAAVSAEPVPPGRDGV
jgi:prevent-host-death family protein